MDEARLERIPLFAELSRRRRRRLLAHLRELRIGPGDHIVDEGESAHEFFVIEEGRAAVIAEGKHLTELGPGDFLGEIGLLRGSARTSSVIALTPVTALVMNEEAFRRMARSMPKVATQITAAADERLRRDGLFGIDRAAPPSV
jgi:CRP/FNR family cyclic AMP-dependent transcriptional regulator